MLSSKTSAVRNPAMPVARRKRGSAPGLNVVGCFFIGLFFVRFGFSVLVIGYWLLGLPRSPHSLFSRHEQRSRDRNRSEQAFSPGAFGFPRLVLPVRRRRVGQ